MQPAHVAPKGHVQATAALEVSAPTGTISRDHRHGQDAVGRRAHEHEPDARAGAAGVRGGRERRRRARRRSATTSRPTTPLLDNFEVGLRYAGGGWRFGARYQILRHETEPFDMTIGARRRARRRSRSRWPRTSRSWRSTTSRAGRSTSRRCRSARRAAEYRVWARAEVSLLALQHGDAAVDSRASTTPDLASFEGHTIYYGGQGGFALGYRYVFFAFELTLAEISGTGDVTTAPDPRNGEARRSRRREPRRLRHLSHLRLDRRILSAPKRGPLWAPSILCTLRMLRRSFGSDRLLPTLLASALRR